MGELQRRVITFLFLTLSCIYSFLAEEDCGWDLEGTYGRFDSPSYYGNYPNNSFCNWTITVPNNSIIFLRFTFFELEDSPGCEHDHVEVYEADGFNEHLIVKLCGQERPDTVESKGNRMHVIFRSDSTLAFAGFHAIYGTELYTACGSHLTEPSGAIESPHTDEDDSYPPFAFCLWTITALEDSVVKLKFHLFNVESEEDGCPYDQVEVYDGNSSSHTLIERLCGEQMPPLYVSKGNQMLILFKSDGTFSAPGFKANYTTDSCGSHFTKTSGALTSPGYPYTYSRFTFCNWTITVPDGFVISLSFSSFDVEPDPDCKYDQLDVYDGNSSNNSLIGSLCGQGTPSSLVSKGNQMYILFKSDQSREFSGFRARYHTWYRSTIEGSTTSTPSPSSSSNIGRHQMTISPQPFQPNTKSLFSVNCSLDNLNRDVENVVSMVLSRKNILNNQMEEVASITYFHPELTTLAAEAAGGIVEGHLDMDQGTCYLRVKWSFPTLAEAADYMCEANALNNRGRPVVSNVYAAGSVTPTISSNMTQDELIEGYQQFVTGTIGLTDAYLNLTRANTVLLTYLFNPPFEDENGTRYFLSRFQSVSAIDAGKMCSILLKGMLVEIDTVAEYSFLQQYLTINLELDETVLTGATDETTEGVWTNRNSNILVPVLDWGGNQPVPDRSKNCLALQRTTSGVHMTDITSSANSDANTVHFICEVNALYD